MKAAKRLLAGLLSAVLALPLSTAGMAVIADEEQEPAAGIQESPYKELVTVMDMNSAGKHSSGYQASINQMKINLKGIDPTVDYDNLALFINVYIENRDNPDDVTIFEDSQGQFQLLSEIKDGVYYETCWNWNKRNEFNLHSGWNTLLLNFSTEQKAKGFAATKCSLELDKIENFRLAFWNFNDFENYDQYRIRIAGATIVDTRYERETEPAYDNTDPVAGEWPTLTDANTYTATGGKGGLLHTGTHTVETPIDVTHHDPSKLFLSLEMYAGNATDPENVAGLFVGGQIRLFSQNSGNNFAHFYSRDCYADFKPNEWNTLLIPWSKLVNPGNIDQSEINRIYIYYDSVNHDEFSGNELELKVRNVQIIDTTNEPKEMAVPTLFGDGMIFQQKKPISLWGTTEAGDTVTATLKKGETVVQELAPVTVGEDGSWKVTFNALDGSYDAYTITLVDKDAEGVRSTKTLNDIVIGEVWVTGGQSNMALNVGSDAQKDDILAKATNANIRIYLEPSTPVPNGQKQPLDPLSNIEGAYWAKGNDKNSVANTTSVGYNFAVQLQEQLNMPVGILNTAVGGSHIESWISRKSVDGNETYKNFLDYNDKYCDANWWPSVADRQSAFYNTKIGPLKGYNTAGAIWYQGESSSANPEIYGEALSLLQKDWSETFGFGEERMPFIFAQLAPHYYAATNGMSASTYLAYMAEAMSEAWEANPTTMGQIAIYDLPLGHWKDAAHTVSGDPIHPNDKRPVAARMATAATNLVYGGQGETTSPVYQSMEIKGSAIEVTLDHVGADGLKIGNDAANLQGFAIAGADGVFVNAQAEITGKNTVKVWSDKVTEPKNVTYAFTTFNMAANLMGSDGFAAIPFRTTTDTVDSKLFHANDWMYADGEVWVSVAGDDKLKDQQHLQADFHDLWTVAEEGTTHSYDTETKSEGKASLKVTYTGNTATIAPDFASYRSQAETQFANFGGLTVDLKNPDDRAKTVKLALVSGGKTYTSVDTAELAAKSDFTAYDFSLAKLTDETGAAVTNVAEVLAGVTALQFVVTDTAAGEVYLDNIRFAVTLDVPSYTLGDVDGSHTVDVIDALMALQKAANKINLDETQTLAANVDGEGEVTAYDALLILKYATGAIAAF